MYDVFDGIKIKELFPFRIYNTGTIYDVITGSVVRGINKKWYIQGGLPIAPTGFAGKENSFKSTLTNSLILNSMDIYKNAKLMINETEGSYNESRLQELNPNIDVQNRVVFLPGVLYDLGKLHDTIKSITENKEKHKAEFTVETPFVNAKTGKKAKAWLPTYLCIDSFSEAFSVAERQMMDDGGLDNKKNQTIYMREGNKKTVMMREIRRWCELYGICTCMVAHVGKNNADMDSYGPPSKQMTYIPHKEKIKNVGSKFLYLTRNCSLILKAKPLQDTNKNAWYPYGDTPINDINEVSLVTIRGKENSSGYVFPFIVSQEYGLLNDATHYNYLYINQFGMYKGKPKQKCILKPEVSLSRNTIRELASSSYELRRALELCARYVYIKNNWSVKKLPIDFSYTADQLYDKITKSGSIQLNDILNTTSNWTYDQKKNNRPYMSIFDVLETIK